MQQIMRNRKQMSLVGVPGRGHRVCGDGEAVNGDVCTRGDKLSSDVLQSRSQKKGTCNERVGGVDGTRSVKVNHRPTYSLFK